MTPVPFNGSPSCLCATKEEIDAKRRICQREKQRKRGKGKKRTDRAE